MLNTIVIAGRLATDPKTRNVGDDNTVTSFRVAFEGHGRENTVFLPCDAWGKQGEAVSKYLKKGDGIMVSGKLKQDEWTNSDGEDVSIIKIVARDVKFFPKPKNAPKKKSQPKKESAPSQEYENDDDLTDDIPF